MNNFKEGKVILDKLNSNIRCIEIHNNLSYPYDDDC